MLSRERQNFILFQVLLITMEYEVLDPKIREVVKLTLSEILENEDIDFSKMDYDSLLAAIHYEDAEGLEEMADDILDNKNLTWDEKVRLWDLINERLVEGIESRT